METINFKMSLQFILVFLALLLLSSACCRTHRLDLNVNNALPLTMSKMQVDTSNLENRVLMVQQIKEVNLKFKKKILRKVRQAQSVCFIIPGRLKTWITLEIDTVPIQVSPNFIRVEGKYYRTVLFKKCTAFLNASQ